MSILPAPASANPRVAWEDAEQTVHDAEQADVASAERDKVCDTDVVFGMLEAPDPTLKERLVWAVIYRARGFVASSGHPKETTSGPRIYRYQTTAIVDAETNRLLNVVTAATPEPTPSPG